jgi:hypothetical protein
MLRSVFFSAVIAFGLCSASLAIQPKPGDPAVDGKDYLISEVDFRAIISVARAWLIKTHPSFSVRRVHVVTRDEVEVYVRGRITADYGEEDDMHLVGVFRSKKGWHVGSDTLDRMPTID